MSKHKKIFYGWYLCVASLLMLMGSTGIVNNSAGQFLKSVTASLDISRFQFSFYLSVMNMAYMITCPLVGRVYKMMPPKKATVMGGFLMIMSLGSLSIVSNLYQLYMIAIFLGIGIAFVSSICVNVLINNWFVEKRGTVLGIALTGTGFGSMIFNPLASGLIVSLGYHWAYRILALCSLILFLPMFLLYKYQPKDMMLQPYGMVENNSNEISSIDDMPGMLYSQAIKNIAFWGICFISFGMTASAFGLFSHSMPYLTDLGYNEVLASRMVGTMGLFIAIGRIFFGWFNDKIGIRTTFTVILMTGLCGVGTLAFARYEIFAYIASVMFGLTMSSVMLLPPLLTVAAFGQKDFANIFGSITFFSMMGPTISPTLTGLIFDHTHSYAFAFALYFSLLICVFFVGQFILSKLDSVPAEIENRKYA